MTLEDVRSNRLPRWGRSVLGSAAAALVLMTASPASAQDPTAPPAAKRAPRAAARPAPARKAKPPARATQATENRDEADAEVEADPAQAEPSEVEAPDEAPDEAGPSEVEADSVEADSADEEGWEQAEADATAGGEAGAEEPAPRRVRRQRHRYGGADHHHHRHDHRRRAPARRRASRAPAAPPPVDVRYPSAAASSYWAQPYELEYVEGAEVPEGYRKDTRVRRGLVVGGAVTFGTTWLLSALSATVMLRSDDSGDDYGGNYRNSDKGMPGAAALYVPVAGPFIAIHTLDTEGAGTAVLFVDGLAQAAGVSMFIAGLAAKRTVLVKTPEASMSFAPTAPGAPSGASLIGTF